MNNTLRFLASCVLGLAWCQAGRAQVQKVGEVSRIWEARDHRTGAPLKLSDFEGKIVLLHFVAYWGTDCTEAASAIESEIHGHYTARGGNPSGVPVQVLSMNIDQVGGLQTDPFSKGSSLIVDDVRLRAYYQYRSAIGIPTFVLINGVANSPDARQWEILDIYSGWSQTAVPDRLRRQIDRIRKSASAAAPAITVQPVGTTAISGQNLSLFVAAAGWPRPSYQWYRDGVPSTGATADHLTISGTSVANSGTYTVVVSNALGAMTSRPATVKVMSALVSQETADVGAPGAVYQIAVTSYENWDVSADAPWISTSRTRGTKEANLAITVAPNPSGSSRTAIVNVGGSVHTVRQWGRDAAAGEAWAVGAARYGQLGDNRLLQRLVPIMIADGVKQVAAAYRHTLYLKTDGTLWGTGVNGVGQLGDGTGTDRGTPVQIADGVQMMAAGDLHSLFLKSDGSLWAMGYNSDGQLGDPTTISRTSPVQVATGVKTIAAGHHHSLFIKTDGSLWGMGRNYSGQLGDGTTTNRSRPVQIAAGVKDISAGLAHTLFVKTDGTLWAMGDNTWGQLGDGSESNRTSPVQIASGVDSVAAGYYHSFFLRNDSTLWGMGHNHDGQLGDGSTVNRNRPAQIAADVRAASGGFSHSLFLKNDGTLWAVGANASGEFGDGTTIGRKSPVQVAAGVAAASAGMSYSFFVRSDRTMWATGMCNVGQLGDGTTFNQRTPIQVAFGVAAVAAGASHSLLVKHDGSLWTAGYNGSGALGTGSDSSSSTFQQIGSDVRQVAAGGSHTLFTRTDGSLWAAGAGYYTGKPIPVRVATDVVAVAAGYAHSLFIKTDGSLWAMGRNDAGQLGDGSTTQRFTPVKIATGVKAIAAGFAHSVFVKMDGTLWATGDNVAGQLGDRSNTRRTSPVQIARDVKAVAAGDYHTLFLTIHGTLWVVGSNGYGQLGIGSFANRNSPEAIVTRVQSIAAGAYHSLYIKTDGSLWAMGLNDSGQLGDGSTTTRVLPLEVADNVVAVAGGRDFTLFNTQTGTAATPSISTQPLSQATTAGNSVSFSVAASAHMPLLFQWRKDGVALVGATGATLTLNNATPIDSGSYDVVVSSAGGSMTSQAAALTVAVQSSRISNLSVRTKLASEQALTAGFVTSGSKRLLVRAVGPSLYAVAGLTDYHPDPRLAIVNQNTGAIVAQNDTWESTLSDSFGSVGAFPLTNGSKDSALLHSINGAHTAQVTGPGSGVVLVEVYDAERAGDARLTNVSARNHVGTGEDILIVGFVIEGNGEKLLLLRGIGPALRELWGVPGVLGDPKLEVYRQDGQKLMENDNWDAGLAALFDLIGAFQPPANSRDAALRITLPPGAYTVQVSGVGGSTGDGLVELYELP